MATIICPNCKHTINVDEALKHQIEESVSAKYQSEKNALQKQQETLEAQMIQLKKKNEEEKEKALSQQKQELWVKAQEEASKKSGRQMQEMMQQLKEQELRAKDAESRELELLKRKREIEEREKQLELKVERELERRLETEVSKATKIELERSSLKEREYQKQIQDMKTALEDARRKATTVSQQLQGEVLELQLENLLRDSFPHDHIEEVKKGQLGADILHTVKNQFGKSVGIIVWESKQTEHFSEKWLAKLREDCRACHGSVAVLVSRSLPEDIQTCAERDRVWISAIDFVLPLAELLRQTLLKVDQEKTAQSGKDVKTELLYSYINSVDFRGKVEAIVESFREMREDLDREQRALSTMWKKREKQILRLATNTARMYGDMQGLVGASLPSIHGLELDSPVETHELVSGTLQEELF